MSNFVVGFLSGGERDSCWACSRLAESGLSAVFDLFLLNFCESSHIQMTSIALQQERHFDVLSTFCQIPMSMFTFYNFAKHSSTISGSLSRLNLIECLDRTTLILSINDII